MLNLKNTLDGYLKNVEVIGNTIQDTNNLADIRSVGDKVEGQELYKIDVVSCGKNLFDGIYKDNSFLQVTGGGIGDLGGASGHKATPNYVKLKPNSTYRFSTSNSKGAGIILFFYDKNKKYIRHVDTHIMPYTTLTTNENEYYIRWYGTDANISAFTNTQLEEGTVATEYEPYQENKLEILSPVQLEKVGDVADRIICKDGVWGVEKNILNYRFTDNITWNMDNQLTMSFRFFVHINNVPGISNIKTVDASQKGMVLTNKLGVYTVNNLMSNDVEGFGITHSAISLRVNSSKLNEVTSQGMNKWIHDNKFYFKYITTQSQFIPLPHDQQVKLRTFAGQTNIFFNTEIAGQIKAQVPKSLGATVNTHTEQIKDLHNSLDRVKKLEETTVSTIETESSFTSVDATNNGYFEGVKLEGKTLSNIVMKYNSSQFTLKNAIQQSDGSFKLQHGTDVNASCVVPKYKTHLYKPNTTYTVIVDIKENTTGTYLGVSAVNSPIDSVSIIKRDFTNLTGISTLLFTTRDDITLTDKGVVPSQDFYFGVWKNGGDLSKHITFKYWILEGDHTNNPPEYFEGLMSVGQDVEEVSVESMNVNLFDRANIRQGGFVWSTGAYHPTSTDRCCTKDYIKVEAGMTLYRNKKCVFVLYDKDYKHLGNNSIGNKNPSDYHNTPYVVAQGVTYIHIVFSSGDYGGNANDNIFDDTMISTSPITEYIPHKSNKKPLLYYNPTTETWEKPILREWDSIEKHSDGKYYYHKRSGEVVLNGSEKWVYATNEVGGDDFARCYTQQVPISHNSNFVCDKFSYGGTSMSKFYGEGIGTQGNPAINIKISLSKLATHDIDGFKAWLQANPTTVVYQLAQEEVYECTNIDLMTYSGETNYIINSGTISPKSLLKVHNNISNVVKILQEKVNLLENKFIAGLKSVLSGDMYSLATILYPEDFERNDNIEQDIMVIPE